MLKQEPKIFRHSSRLYKMPAKNSNNLFKGHKLINEPLKKPCKNHKSETEPSKKESPLLNKVHKRQENKYRSSSKECKKLSREQRRLEGGLMEPNREQGRNLRKMSLHGWYTGMRLISQRRNLEEEVGEW